MIRRAFAFSLISQWIALAITFIASVAVARLISPREYGIFSVAMAATFIVSAVRDFGSTKYIVSRRDIDDADLRAAYTVMLLVGWGLGLLLLLASPLAAMLYHEPAVGTLLRILAISFFLMPIGQPGFALLNREMRFGAIGMMVIASALVNAVIAIVLVAHGEGAIGLAWGSVAGTVTVSAMSLLFERRARLLLPSLAGWRAPLRFGAAASGATILSQLGIQSGEIALGWTKGFVAAGFFSRAGSVALLFDRLVFSGVGRVLDPMISNARRIDEAPIALLRQANEIGAAAALATYIFVAAFAGPIVAFLYGPKWLPAAPVLAILCLARAIGDMPFIAGSTYNGFGMAGLQLRAELRIQPAAFALALLSAGFGAIALAWSRVALSLWAYRVHYRNLNMMFDGRGGAILLPSRIALTLFAALAVSALALRVASEALALPILPTLAAAGLCYGVAAYAAARLLHHPAGEIAAPIERALLARLRAA